MKIHVLNSVGRARYRVVLHTATPSGNNQAGNTWKSCLIAAGLNVSVLPVGTGVGQITTAENAQVVAGDVIEIVSEIKAEPAGIPSAAVTQMADALIAQGLAVLQERFRFYGYTQVT